MYVCEREREAPCCSVSQERRNKAKREGARAIQCVCGCADVQGHQFLPNTHIIFDVSIDGVSYIRS